MTKLKDLDIETIFYIFDDEDSGFEGFYGTIDDVVEYLREQQEQIEGYNEVDGFIKNLERYGLTFKIIN